MDETRQKAETNAANRRLMNLRALGGAPLMVAIALPLVSGLLLVVQAALLANVLGRTIEQGLALAAVLPMILAIAALLVTRSALAFFGEQAGQAGAERIKLGLRQNLFGHIVTQRHELGLSPASGAISATVVDQTEALENFFARYLPAMISAAFLPIAFAVILFPVDWVVALLFLFTAPLIPVFMALAGMGAQAATDRQATALTRLSGYFADRLRGLVTLKLFGQEKAATQAVHAASEDLRRRTNAVLRIAFLSSAILEFFAALGVAGVALYVGLTYLGFLHVHPEMTLVAGLFALLMAPEVYQPLRQLAAHYHDRAAARSALEEVERQIARIDALTMPGPDSDAVFASRPAALSIENLTVQTDTGRPVLDSLTLDLAPGESLAIMGQSGVGKSTLARAITRLIPFEGNIVLDGEALAGIDEPSLRRRVAFITQKPHIFHGSIADNIGFADPKADRKAIAAAAKRALVSEFANTLSHGLDTLVGEGGEGLSGGQAQRVALARLFLTDPDLVILDEPTAHLDPETETSLLDAIFAFCANRSLILLTHARPVAHRADRLMTLAGGKLLPSPHRRTLSTPDREGMRG